MVNPKSTELWSSAVESQSIITSSDQKSNLTSKQESQELGLESSSLTARVTEQTVLGGLAGTSQGAAALYQRTLVKGFHEDWV